MERFSEAIRRIKPIAHYATTQPHRLRSCLGLWDLIFYGIGCSVGAGIYSLVGIGAELAGPAVTLSFLLSGVTCIFTSLTYSEFAARVPITGSAYTFVYVTFGELCAWIVGWNLTLGYGISAAGIARSWALYIRESLYRLGFEIPSWLIVYEVGYWRFSLFAALFIILSTTLLLGGVKESSRVNAVITILNLSVLAFVVVYGMTEVETLNWKPYVPNGFDSIISGAGVVFFAYLGFDMVACLAEEVENPKTNLPKGIIGSLVASMLIYISVALIVTGMAPFSYLGRDIPLIKAFEIHRNHWAGTLVSLGSVLGLSTASFTCLMGQPRIFYQMAKDGLLPPILAKLSSTKKLPIYSTIVTGLMVAMTAFLFDLDFLANIISCGTLQVFTFVNAGVLLLRLQPPRLDITSSYERGQSRVVLARVVSFVVSSLFLSFSIVGDWHWLSKVFAIVSMVLSIRDIHALEVSSNATSTFQCPCVPLIPCLGIWTNIYVMAGLPNYAWLGIGIWSSLGLLIYIFYGIHNSALRTPDTGVGARRPLI